MARRGGSEGSVSDRKIPDPSLGFWRDQRVWSSSFNLPSPAAHSTQEFRIGLLGDATFWRFLGILSVAGLDADQVLVAGSSASAGPKRPRSIS